MKPTSGGSCVSSPTATTTSLAPIKEFTNALPSLTVIRSAPALSNVAMCLVESSMTIIATPSAFYPIPAEIIAASETAPKSQSPRPPHELGYFRALRWHLGATIQSDWVPLLREKHITSHLFRHSVTLLEPEAGGCRCNSSQIGFLHHTGGNNLTAMARIECL